MDKVYEPSLWEDGIYKKWEKSGLFNPDNLDLSKNAPSYSIVMPPPNVTGRLHMGHAVMTAIEDILIRYYRMKGYRSLWVPGTDHAAIATSTVVEKILKKEGFSRHKLGREKFLKRVEGYARETHDTIVNQVRKMGASCDWSREAYTLDETRTKAVRAVFKLMYDDGLIFKGDRVVNWCPRCHSTLADIEVEYRQQKGKLYTFKYDKNFPFAISTTRPETKLGDTAVAVNFKDSRYKKYIGKIFKANYCGVLLNLKIISDRGIDINFGTGALGVTPAHSIVDWEIAQKNKLKIIKVINEDGVIEKGFNEYSGKTVETAREMLAKKIKTEGLMETEEDVTNNLSVCYRCDTAVEPLPSLQWFIDVNKKIKKYNKSIKDLSIEAVKEGVFGRDKIRIVPERFEKDYFHWVKKLRNWCISRQIWFGHRIPVWYKGEDVYVGITEPKEPGWQQDESTLDTWFSSGLWTFSSLASSPEQIKIEKNKLIIDSQDFKNYHPTAVLETGYDILFFWVARMIVMTTYAIGDIPFQGVYLHGLIRDEQGRKMSKSLGNVIDPLDIIKKYGTDATRLSLVIGSTPGNDMNLSEAKAAGFRNFTNKLWNIARYILQNTKSRKYTKIELSKCSTTDYWMLNKMHKLIINTEKDLKNYRFSQVGEKLRDFTWHDLADWYIEVSKFEKNKNKDQVLFNILVDLLKLWHPFTPFVTEAVWKNIDDSFLMTAKWPDPKFYEKFKDNKVASRFDLAKNIITTIRNARAQYSIKPNQKIKAVVYAGERFRSLLSQANLIKSLRTGIEQLEIKEKGKKIKQAIYLTVDSVEIYLMVEGFDLEKEIKRLEYSILKQEKWLKGLEAKLTNKEFIKKAPKEIIEQEKTKLKPGRTEFKQLKEQLKNLR